MLGRLQVDVHHVGAWFIGRDMLIKIIVEQWRLYRLIKKNKEEVMAAIDNLIQAVVTLQATQVAVEAKIDALIVAGSNDVAIQAAADAVDSVSVALNNKIA